MYALLSMGIEAFSAAVVVIPALLLANKIYYHDFKKTAVYCVFVLYLSAVYAVTGLPVVTYIEVDPYINIIPFVDMASDLKNAILNVILFVPLGVMLPLLWEEFRNAKNTFLLGLGTTLTIEVLQIFTFRTTDINDVITNTAGTTIGYFVAKLLIQKSSKEITVTGKKGEAFLLFAGAFGIMFFIQPFIASLMWEAVL